MYSRKLSMKTLAVMIAFASFGFSGSAYAIEASAGGENARDMRIAALKADPRVSVDGPCDPATLDRLIDENNELVKKTIERIPEYQARPTKTDELDCFSSLLNAEYGFNIPSAGSLAKSVFSQMKEAACNIAVNKSNQLLDTAGLNFNQDLGGQFYIPGTNERINVDAGNVNTDVGTQTRSNTRNNQNSGVTRESTIERPEGGGISGSGGASGGSNSGDLGNFLNGIF